MPNIGRSSRGCYTCRARRIKCDRGEPGCNKCKIFGRPCPGYRDESSLLFRNQNDYAKVKVMTGPTRAPSLGEFRSASTPAAYVTMPPSLPLNFETQCVDQFFSQYVMAEGRTGYGYMDFIPSMCASADILPCLKSAVPAVALANAAKQRNQPELLSRARAKYGQTLCLVNKTLQGPPELFASDSVRLTLLMLTLYELITGEGFAKDLWDSHHDGRMMLLRVQSEHLKSNRPAWNLFRVMHTQLLAGCLLKKSPPPPDSVKWLSMGNQNGPIEEVSVLFVELIQIVSYVQGVAASWPDSVRIQQLREVILHGMELDLKIVQWAESLPSIWKYTSIRNNSTTSSPPNSVQVHQDFFTAGTWNSWRSMRIRLIQILMATVELLREEAIDFGSQMIRWRKTLLDLANDVCSTVPYLLGEIDGQGIPRGTAKGIALGGYMLLYPLQIISTVEGLPESYHDWIETKLIYIAGIQGIEQASLILKFNKIRKSRKILPFIGDVVTEVESLMPSLKGQQ